MLSLREKHEYEEEIEHLKRQVRMLTVAKSKYKLKWKEILIANNLERDIRAKKATAFITNKLLGDDSLSYKDIAGKCFLVVGTIYNLKCKIQNQLMENSICQD